MPQKIQHKRSAVAGKAPQPADLDYGEIAVNYEATDPALYVKDSADAIRRVTPVDATEAIKGIAEIATDAEVAAGTDDTRFVTPAKLNVYLTEKLKATWLPSNSISADGLGTSTWNGPADTLTATPDIEVAIAGGAWGTGGAVSPADQVQARWIAAAVAAAAHGVTLTGHIANASGSVAVDYTVTVDKLPTAITIAAKLDVTASAVVESDASTAIGGINAPARLWLKTTDGTAAQVSIAGAAWVAVPATAATGLVITQGQTFKLRHTTQAGASTVTTTTVYVGWDVGSSVEASYVTTNAVVTPLVAGATTTIAGKAEIGSILTATAGTATGGTAPITYATRWQVSADGTSGWADIAGATALTYAIQAGDKDKYLRAVTTATDSTAPTPQTLDLASGASAQVTQPPSITLGWNADTDAYTREPLADRAIVAHVAMRRCVMPNGGTVAYYLDADDSTKKAGDWLRLVETTELSVPYTGTHGAEVANTVIRAAAPAWAAGTYTKGQRVSHSGSVWECLAATTTATPAAGTVAANLTGADGQVMVEIPKFSVWHETAPAGSYLQHTFHLQLGDKTDGSWQVHPAFVKPDSSTRSHMYIGAYQGTGTDGNGSASGVNNTTQMTRAACRTACAGRGAGWHQLGYWEYNAVQWLLYTEYQDMNSQKVLGDGATSGAVYVINTGLSNSRGNRCGHATTGAGANTDYVSYRGIENVYGRAWQWVDGFNANGLDVYLNNNPATWADDTQAGYTASGTVSAGNAYSRDLLAQTAFLPGSSTGASETTFIGDYMWTSSGWRVANVGGSAANGARVGALCLSLDGGSSFAGAGGGGRLAYAA